MANAQSLPPVPVAGAEYDYKPVSGVAVAAILVASAYTAIVLGTIAFAYYFSRPALNVHLLWLAALGLALAVAGRLHIRRAERSRTGMACVRAAWWLSVLGGVAFGAYIWASQLAIHQQAETAATLWFDKLEKQKVDEAFLLTLTPQARQAVNPNDTRELERRFGPGPLPAFRNSELVRFFKRNGSDVEIKPLGMNSLDQIENGFRIDLAYLLTNPEGAFEVNLALIGTEGQTMVGDEQTTVGREWQIGMFQSAQGARARDGTLTVRGLTEYGWLVQRLQEEAYGQTQQWLLAVLNKQIDEVLLATLPAADRPRFVAQLLIKRIGAPLPPWLLAPIPVDDGDLAIGDSSFAFLAKRGFFKIEGPDAGLEESKNKVRELWNHGGLANVGMRKLQNLEKMPLIAIAADKIEFTVPVEARLPGLPVKYTGARIVLGCDSPDLLREVQDLKAKAKANPVYADRPPASLYASLPARNWRVLRLETNLQELQQQARPEGP